MILETGGCVNEVVNHKVWTNSNLPMQLICNFVQEINVKPHK